MICPVYLYGVIMDSEKVFMFHVENNRFNLWFRRFRWCLWSHSVWFGIPVSKNIF